MALLTLEGVAARYGQFQALRDISLDVEEGETLAVIGANGAGKTTLMRVVCGLLANSAGKVRLRGMEIGGLPAQQLTARGIAMVPEGRRLFRSLTVEDNLLIGGYCRRKGPWTLSRVYELFPELVKRRNNRGLDLSGGEQQMVAIGRALMSNPDLLLMDEISLGLAPIVVRQIYNALPYITGDGMSVVIVEQDVNRGFSVARRFCCLLEGRVSLAGPVADIDRNALTDAYFGVAA
ncbi:ABC transporter ATP-binding protein [Rhizobium sp. ACO-34A]|nr:ABC transporter ATP-binding protein [Rhizobium sp. ACO-34A]ATN32286.1 ABC transporter ATP-binding protein [Rhizobium sp. ACO-34A]